MSNTAKTLLICLMAIPATGAFAQLDTSFGGDDTQSPSQITARLVPSHLVVQPGQTLHLAVNVHIDDAWVFYAPDPGPYALGATLEIQAPSLKIGPSAWPVPAAKTTQIGDESVTNNVYTHRTILYVSLTVPQPTELPGKIDLTAVLTGQICKIQCVDVRIVEQVSLQVASQSVTNPDWESDDAFADGLAKARPVTQRVPATASAPAPMLRPESTNVTFPGTIARWLAVAILAGLSLNIMPCVLPIIPIRIHSVLATAGQSRRRFVTLGLAFALGVWLFFGGFALANIIIHQIFGEALSWSAQWKLPPVRLGLALLVVTVAANLLGAFTVTVPSKIASMEPGHKSGGHLGSIGMGLMLAILATPCSAGVLLGVLGWAQGQPLWLATLAIFLMGVGMALPHAVLCAFPKLVEKLPKPGRWMELFKQSMGFVLLPLALWLLTTLGPDPGDILRSLLIAAALASGLWVWGTWIRYDTPAARKWLYRGLVLAGVLAAGWMLVPQWKPADGGVAGEVKEARDAGNVVVLKVTADWCIECKVIDYTVYKDAKVLEALAASDVVLIKADVTNRGPTSTWLNEFHAESPPYTLVFPAQSGSPVPLRGTDISTHKLLQAIDRVQSRQ